MIRAKNYETVSKFVTVMTKASFFPDMVYICDGKINCVLKVRRIAEDTTAAAIFNTEKFTITKLWPLNESFS